MAMTSLKSVFIRSVDLTKDSSPADVAHAAFPRSERDIQEQGLAFDVFPRQEPPIPAVLRVIPVVAHHEVLPRGHRNRPVFAAWVAGREVRAPREQEVRIG